MLNHNLNQLRKEIQCRFIFSFEIRNGNKVVEMFYLIIHSRSTSTFYGSYSSRSSRDHQAIC